MVHAVLLEVQTHQIGCYSQALVALMAAAVQLVLPQHRHSKCRLPHLFYNVGAPCFVTVCLFVVAEVEAGEEGDDTTGAGGAASAASSPPDLVPSADLLTLDKAVTESALIQVKRPILSHEHTEYNNVGSCAHVVAS